MITVAGENDIWYYYHRDRQGNIIALSSETGSLVEKYEYTPYGMPLVYDDVNTFIGTESCCGNPYMFTGRRYDSESGIYYYRARMYSPLLGRFMQVDPLRYYDSMNLYQYCGNNPVNYLDPSGLEYCSNAGGPMSGPIDSKKYEDYVNSKPNMPSVPPSPMPNASTLTTPSGNNINAPDYYSPHETVKCTKGMDKNQWLNKVWNQGDWDYKHYNSAYEDLGNFDFGVSGSAMGFSEFELSFGSKVASYMFGAGEDSARDQQMILEGVKWYKSHYGNAVQCGYGPIKYRPYPMN